MFGTLHATCLGTFLTLDSNFCCSPWANPVHQNTNSRLTKFMESQAAGKCLSDSGTHSSACWLVLTGWEWGTQLLLSVQTSTQEQYNPLLPSTSKAWHGGIKPPHQFCWGQTTFQPQQHGIMTLLKSYNKENLFCVFYLCSHFLTALKQLSLLSAGMH